jgi:hypothetical protein
VPATPATSSAQVSVNGLLERIIDKVEKKMLKSVLMKHAHIR